MVIQLRKAIRQTALQAAENLTLFSAFKLFKATPFLKQAVFINFASDPRTGLNGKEVSEKHYSVRPEYDNSGVIPSRPKSLVPSFISSVIGTLVIQTVNICQAAPPG